MNALAALAPGPGNSLRAKLRAAFASLRRGGTQAAQGQLRTFEAEVRAQAGKTIGTADAELLAGWAQAIRGQVGGS